MRRLRVSPARLIATLVLAGVLLSLGMVTLGRPGSDSGGVTSSNLPPATSSERRSRPISMVERTQYRMFAAFRRPAQPLPNAISRLITTSELGLNPQLARKLTTAFGVTVWVVPGRGFLCLVAQAREPGYTCASSAEAVDHGGIDISNIGRGVAPATRPIRTLIGLARDHAKRVTIRTGPRQKSVRVVRGLYAFQDRVPDAPTSISVR